MEENRVFPPLSLSCVATRASRSVTVLQEAFCSFSASRQQPPLSCGLCVCVPNPCSSGCWGRTMQISAAEQIWECSCCRGFCMCSSHTCPHSNAARWGNRRRWGLDFNLANMKNSDGHYTCGACVISSKQMPLVTQARKKPDRSVHSKQTCQSSPWSFRTVRRLSTIVPNA